MNTTYYAVQVLEDGLPRLVPHTGGTENFEFLDRKKAVEFLNDLIENNPNDKFRLLKRVEGYKPEKWMQCIPKISKTES